MLYTNPAKTIVSTDTELILKPDNPLQAFRWVLMNEEYSLRMAFQLKPLVVNKKTITYVYTLSEKNRPSVIEYQSPGAFNRIVVASILDSWNLMAPHELTKKDCDKRLRNQGKITETFVALIVTMPLLFLCFHFLGVYLVHLAQTTEIFHRGTCQGPCAEALAKQTLIFIFPWVAGLSLVLPFAAVKVFLFRHTKVFYPASDHLKWSFIIYLFMVSFYYVDAYHEARVGHYFENVKSYWNGDLRINKRPE